MPKLDCSAFISSLAFNHYTKPNYHLSYTTRPGISANAVHEAMCQKQPVHMLPTGRAMQCSLLTLYVGPSQAELSDRQAHFTGQRSTVPDIADCEKVQHDVQRRYQARLYCVYDLLLV